MKCLKSVMSAVVVAGCIGMGSVSYAADALPADVKAKIDSKIAIYKAWGTDAEVVKAVKDYNTTPPAEYKDMTNDKWKGLTVMSTEVRALTKNGVATFIKTKKDESVTEGFVSGADGTKVGFLSKTTSWSHKGKPKHDIPMTGKVWIGSVEVDESTGIQSVQVGFPVMDGTKAIGAYVLGFSVSKL